MRLLALLAVAALLPLVGCSRESGAKVKQPGAQPQGGQPTKPQTTTAPVKPADQMDAKLTEERETIAKNLRSRLTDLKTQIQDLEKSAQKLTGDAKDKLHKELTQLQQKREDAEKMLPRLEQATTQAQLQELRTLRDEVTDLERSVKTCKEKLKT
jgi:uncharacterized phage infection (PIP) family protein YhgE